MKRIQKQIGLLGLGMMMVSFAACSLPNAAVKQLSSNPATSQLTMSNPTTSQVNTGNPTTSQVTTYDETVNGIEYSYWVRLDNQMGSIKYETDLDDVNYRIADYGNYMTVYITNNGSEEATIGGKYQLQRLVDGEYVDLEDNMNLKYGDVYVQDMQRIILHDEADGSEIVLADDEEQFTIAPGQSVKAEFLTMIYPILDSPDYAGEYRLIYGDAVIDFKLFCDVVC